MHSNETDIHMADVSAKSPTYRRAVAMGRIIVGENAFTRIKEGTLPKGDVLTLCEISGIMGAKKTSDLIPLCHPLPLEHVAISYDLEEASSSIAVYCTVSTSSKTGVEMEALAGVNAALLTIYDLTKPVEPALTISDIRLLLKEGGKKGYWVHPDGIPEKIGEAAKPATPLKGVSAAVVTLSDRASQAVYEDISGECLQTILTSLGADIAQYQLLPDDKEQIVSYLAALADKGEVECVITTGGTGLGKRDVTPEALEAVCDRMIPGIGEALRSSGAHYIPTAWLSRTVAGTIGDMLVVALPGSVNAVKEGMELLKTLLPHALHVVHGKETHALPKKEAS